LYIKSLELENFKSFGGLKTIPFLPGFTVITGPNGSGKSNISDAILFSLGPKSSKVIRAGKLSDLIFNGGGEGQAAKKCRVTLTLDNTDREISIEDDEIRLTRVIKQSSDNCYSYFYVNGKSSSLGEFDDILSSIGLFSHGFNLVQQGDINSIVLMTPTERRKIIELVSGITKFDEDISKAQDKRLTVEGNIEKVRAVLDEVRAQAKSLEEQRNQAIRYGELKDEITRCRYLLLKRSIAALEKDMERTGEEIKSYEGEIERLRERRSEIEKEREKTESDYEKVEGEIAEKGGEDAKKIKEELDRLRIEKAKLNERLRNRTEERARALAELKSLDSTVAKLKRSIGDSSKVVELTESQLGDAVSALGAKEVELEELKSDLAMGDVELLGLRRDSIKLKERIAELEKGIEIKKLEVRSDGERLEELREKAADLEEEIRSIDFEIKDGEWRAEEEKKRREKVEAELKELEDELAEGQKLLNSKSQDLKAVEEELKRLKERYGERPTGLGEEILRARDMGELKGVVGLVEELIEIGEEYRIPIRVAAGGRMNCVLVKDDGSAESCINFLKKRGLGRVVFLPLNKMVPRKPSAKSLLAVRDKSAIGFAIDLVKFDDQYRSALEYVFGDTVVVKDLKSARKLMGGVRLVTLDGELIESSGAMIGGTLKLPPSRVGAREIATRMADLNLKREELSAFTKELKSRCEELMLSIRQNKIDLSSGRMEIAPLSRLKEEREKKISLLQKDADEVKIKSSRLSEGKKELEEKEKILAKTKGDFENLERRLISISKGAGGEKLSKLEEEVKGLRTLKMELSSKLETEKSRFSLSEERFGEIEARAAELSNLEKSYLSEMEDIGKEVEGIEFEIEAHEKVEMELIRHISDLSQKRDSLYNELKDLEVEMEKISSRISAHIDMIDDLKLKLPPMEEQLMYKKEELSSFPEFKDLNYELSLDQIKRTLSKSEKELELMGPVNMRAIDDYERVASKRSGLEGELQRLDDDRRKLIELVDEITSRKIEGFFSLYWPISEEFQKIYRRLSDGGTAEMVLEDENSPFQSGLIIRAKPKGKRPLRMESLSGGEKSLVALSFILAIQKVKPSVFYLFDEVDMFLDGVNAENVSKLIKERSERAQVILISLRKAMIKEAHHLYGISISKPGVSEIIGKVTPELLEVGVEA
jgi:chromosome segregation protein